MLTVVALISHLPDGASIFQAETHYRLSPLVFHATFDKTIRLKQ